MEVFLIIWLILFVYIIAKNIGQFFENENSPVLTVTATIVDMRRIVHHHQNHHSHSYHITFETENGERLVLKVKRWEYRDLSIGDRGKLTHQGTRYLNFTR